MQWKTISLLQFFLHFLSVLQRIKLAVATQREDFRNRIENVSLAEVNYAVLMGLDSVNLKSDVELNNIIRILNAVAMTFNIKDLQTLSANGK